MNGVKYMNIQTNSVTQYKLYAPFHSYFKYSFYNSNITI